MCVKLFTVVKFKLSTPELLNLILVHQFSFETVPILVYMGTHRRSGFGSRCFTTDVHANGNGLKVVVMVMVTIRTTAVKLRDLLFKIIVLGDFGVGKSTLISRGT